MSLSQITEESEGEVEHKTEWKSKKHSTSHAGVRSRSKVKIDSRNIRLEWEAEDEEGNWGEDLSRGVVELSTDREIIWPESRWNDKEELHED